MTREEAREELIAFKDKSWDGMPEEVIDMAIKALEQTRWIPVDERLPEHSEAIYLICTDGGYMCSCRWTNDRYGLGSHPGSDWGWHKMDKPQFSKIVAWMPFEPYEPQERSDKE